jgi:hypothetical protein
MTGTHSERRARYFPHVVLPIPCPPRPIQEESYLDLFNL